MNPDEFQDAIEEAERVGEYIANYLTVNAIPINCACLALQSLLTHGLIRGCPSRDKFIYILEDFKKNALKEYDKKKGKKK